jgi:predicted lipoprotein with Yx(FWY)xxD motif
MPRLHCVVFVMLLSTLSVARAQTQAPPGQAGEVKGHPAMVDAKGLTLYVSDGDRDGQSYCDKTCTTQWHPVKAAARDNSAGDWTVIRRHDGSKQWAYKGRPVYTWYRDKAPGQAMGDGSDGNRWHIARP